MCGIAGEYDWTGGAGARPAVVGRMTAALAHRGPDGAGEFQWPDAVPRIALGARRLKIIDLEHGDQPLFNEDRSVALVYNGEIFNYIELRTGLLARGHVFRTGSDGETLVHLYEEHGLDLFTRLRGMYAFALWDSRRERLVLAVDHVGIKPLYVVQRPGRILFASEVKALFVDPEVPRRLALPEVDTFLSFGYLIGTATLVEGVRRLAPGHALVVEGGAVRMQRHWQLRYPPRAERIADRRTAATEVRTRFREALGFQLRSDVPLGLFLSGGLDSTALLAGMTRAGSGRVKTYTVGYRADPGRETLPDETAEARRAAAHFGADHHELSMSAHDWWQNLDRYVRAHDEPNANPSMIALHALARVAARDVKVVLNGTGGDEVFAGYRGHVVYPRLLALPRPVRALSRTIAWHRLEAWYPALRRRRVLGALPRYLCEWRAAGLARDDALRRLTSFDGQAFSDSLRRQICAPGVLRDGNGGGHAGHAFHELIRLAGTEDPDDLVHALTILTWLPANGLLALDKVTMAHGLEARVPFFDPPLLALAACLAPDVRAWANKGVLREALAADLPPFARDRHKRPFETPIRRWFDEDLADEIRDVLLDPGSLARGLFVPAAVERLVAQHFDRRIDATELVFRLVVLELWQRTTLDDQPPGTADTAGRS